MTRATSVRVDDRNLSILLDDGREIMVPLARFPRLAEATPAQLTYWRLIGNGEGIHWDQLDEDLSVKSLLGG